MTGVPALQKQFRTDSPAETLELGVQLGRQLGIGACIDLRGELGAGKTQLVRGIACGLGVAERIRSPTFTICHVHIGRIPLYHFDAYRIGDPSELLLQGWDEMRESGVVAVEWGQRLLDLLPHDRLVVEIEHCAATIRIVSARATGERSAAWLSSWEQSASSQKIKEE
ncbi:MAG: tRNA (adenosine(37)-N6)-threonylcarbamoyltransferase complex ATPase subunit type 1 TsaE [Planctomycetota bacterium]